MNFIKKTKIFIILFAILILLSNCNREANMNELGGWKNIPIEDPKLEQAILFLKAELALKEPGFIYEDSLNAKSQVVSGIKFQIRAQGSCKLKTCYLDSFIWQKVDGEWELLEYKISESPIEDSE